MRRLQGVRLAAGGGWRDGLVCGGGLVRGGWCVVVVAVAGCVVVSDLPPSAEQVAADLLSGAPHWLDGRGNAHLSDACRAGTPWVSDEPTAAALNVTEGGPGFCQWCCGQSRYAILRAHSALCVLRSLTGVLEDGELEPPVREHDLRRAHSILAYSSSLHPAHRTAIESRLAELKHRFQDPRVVLVAVGHWAPPFARALVEVFASPPISDPDEWSLSPVLFCTSARGASAALDADPSAEVHVLGSPLTPEQEALLGQVWEAEAPLTPQVQAVLAATA